MALREIIFRGKRLDNGEWVEGDICHHDGVVSYIGQHPADGSMVCYDLDPATVCQFTGLLDKNGKRIFEGDIVSSDIERPYIIVEFRDGCFMFNCNDGGEDYHDIMLPILKEPQTVYKYGEVIGNIHDNKLEELDGR